MQHYKITKLKNKEGNIMENYKNVETKMIDVNGTKFAYRELGAQAEIPVIFLNHLTANIDE